MAESYSIGIDLGTTNSCVAYYKNGKVKLLENKEGFRTTPSYILFSEKNPVMVGNYAKKMADLKPEYGVYEVKRLMGRQFSDPNVQNNLNYLPFGVKSVEGKPMVVVKTNEKVHNVTPEEISAYILTKIKTDVEGKLGHSISQAVITVPAYFNVSQREATLEAANKAGFTVLKLLNEPTAAALCYYYKNDSSEDNYSLVYDLGGGTFDVAILKRTKSNIDIVCVDGDSHLGGHDFDNLIVDYVCKILSDLHGTDQLLNRRNARRLKNKCEEAKKCLSSTEETEIPLEALFHKGDEPIEIPLSRQQFEKMAESLFKKTIDIVDKCLKNSNLSKSDIKEVILSGGSTRIPKIQNMISEYFNGKQLNRFNNPDECVAKGAALQAALLSAHPEQRIEQINITDVIPLSLGIRVLGGFMEFIVKKNTKIPASKNVSFFNSSHKENSLEFKVYEGERMNPEKNYLLGNLILDNLSSAPPGKNEVTVTMSVNQNGILTITGKEKVSNNIKDLKIVYSRGHRSDSEINSAVADARANENEDKEFYQFALNKQSVLKYCYRIIYNIEKKELINTYSNIYDRCQKLTDVVDKISFDEKELIDVYKKEIHGKCASLVKKHSFEYMS